MKNDFCVLKARSLLYSFEVRKGPTGNLPMSRLPITRVWLLKFSILERLQTKMNNFPIKDLVTFIIWCIQLLKQHIQGYLQRLPNLEVTERSQMKNLEQILLKNSPSVKLTHLRSCGKYI